MRQRLAVLAAFALLVAACDAADDAPPPAEAPAPADRTPEDGVDGQDLDEPDPEPEAATDGPLDFEAQLLDGEVVDVAATFGGGPVLLWMWAPWCTSCAGEAPAVAAAQGRYDGQVTLLGVPGRDGEDPMRDFVARHGLEAMPQLVDGPDATIWTRFGVRGQPAWVFVSADGDTEVVLGPLGEAGLTQRLDALVASG